MYDVGLIIGPSETIAKATRVKEYASLSQLTTDGFAANSAELAAATKYFGVSPAPEKLLVGVIADGETPLQALQACIAVNPDFDGVYFTEATVAQLKEVAEYLASTDKYHLYYTVSGTAAAAVAADGAFSVLGALDSRRTFGLYSTDVHPGAAAMGAVSGLFHLNGATAVQACYTSISSLTPSDMTAAEVQAIKGANGNVYVSRRNRGLLEQAATGSGMRIDDSIYLDMIRSDIQDALFDLISDSSRRLPQTDMTSALFINAVVGVLQTYVALGIIASGVWTGGNIGQLLTGDTLDNGYVVFCDSYANQSAANRTAHKAMPIRVGFILGGSVESVEINVYAQQ